MERLIVKIKVFFFSILASALLVYLSLFIVNDAFLQTVKKTTDVPVVKINENHINCVDSLVKLNSIDFSECESLRDNVVEDDFLFISYVNILFKYFHEKVQGVVSVFLNSAFSFGILLIISVTNFITVLSFVSKRDNLQFNKIKIDDLSGWCIDTPPLLGICGTLYSVIAFLSNKTDSFVFSEFLFYFAIAAASTIFGAIIAVINHLIWSINNSLKDANVSK